LAAFIGFAAGAFARVNGRYFPRKIIAKTQQL